MAEEQYDEETTTRGPFDRWCVLIEETVGSGSYVRWELTHIKSFGNRADALEEAANLAKGHAPENPAKPRGRRIFRSGEDLWIVQVRGAADQNFHFRVTLAKPETA
ncbi:hypothetical protein JOF56_010419 [Kibdelosporangium banguiense]|uniref:Head-tail adaptor protein n=1 Tax=Kibdelosporangium banguiense TaxID=1365924 RepID=A0ABS4U046_9PSEU|nr:hypothetical protein [Kibdelosporangium banguiense]MBP2330034.1 hypothetical protein [Kibdelosporangium banguiense]